MLPAVILSETTGFLFKQYNLPAPQQVTSDSEMTGRRMIDCASYFTKYSQYTSFWYNEAEEKCHIVSCINPSLFSSLKADKTSEKIYVKYPLIANKLLARGKQYILLYVRKQDGWESGCSFIAPSYDIG